MFSLYNASSCWSSFLTFSFLTFSLALLNRENIQLLIITEKMEIRGICMLNKIFKASCMFCFDFLINVKILTTFKHLRRRIYICPVELKMLVLITLGPVATYFRIIALQVSRLMGKPTICTCENKGADQLRGNREADQCLCFRYTDSTILLLSKYEISCF